MMLGSVDKYPLSYLCPVKSWQETAQHINRLAEEGKPFLFAFDFDGRESFALALEDVDPDTIQYHISGFNNVPTSGACTLATKPYFFRHPLDVEVYRTSFEKVMYHLRRGDSYLLNLTFPVDIETNLGLYDIFQLAEAPYKLWIKDRFVVFSPESFVQMADRRIHTFPMKGTIRADLPDARKLLLSNTKELAEHYTIVDLLRNDLSMVATKVHVERFRYVDVIRTLNGSLLQTSSHISGELPPDWPMHMGDMLLKLMPAGSISGAPKKRTLEVIRQAEAEPRGFYTGVMGFFDGIRLHSAVMIRFIEQYGLKLRFRAGGGITINSQWHYEYEELLQKVALPIRWSNPKEHD